MDKMKHRTQPVPGEGAPLILSTKQGHRWVQDPDSEHRVRCLDCKEWWPKHGDLMPMEDCPVIVGEDHMVWSMDIERWARECAEWHEIREEMASRNSDGITAYQVSLEQRKRMLARGERPMFPPVDTAGAAQRKGRR